VRIGCDALRDIRLCPAIFHGYFCLNLNRNTLYGCSLLFSHTLMPHSFPVGYKKRPKLCNVPTLYLKPDRNQEKIRKEDKKYMSGVYESVKLVLSRHS
jgi:hypothetical protein